MAYHAIRLNGKYFPNWNYCRIWDRFHQVLSQQKESLKVSQYFDFVSIKQLLGKYMIYILQIIDTTIQKVFQMSI